MLHDKSIGFHFMNGDSKLDLFDGVSKPTIEQRPTVVNPVKWISGLSAVYAYATTPELTGFKGVAGAAIIGAAQYIPVSIGVGAAAYVGGLIGSYSDSRSESFMYSNDEGARMGLLMGVFLGAAVTTPLGYSYSKDIVLNGVSASSVVIDDAGIGTSQAKLPDYIIDPLDP